MNNNKRSGCSGCFTSFMFMILIVIICIVYVNVSTPPDVVDNYDESTDRIPVDDPWYDETTSTDDTSDITPDTTPDTEQNNVPSQTPAKEDTYRYYYNQLNSIGKIIYDKIFRAVKSGDDSLKFSNINYDAYYAELSNAITAFTYDNPIYFWITNGYRIEYYDRDGNYNDEITFYFSYYSYWNYTMSPQKYIDEVEKEVNKVVALAKNYDNPFDQAVFVHDYLIHHAEYDHESLAEAKKTLHAASSEYIYSVYGCLVNKKTVCSGYAEAFQMIMNKLGVNTTVVVGDAGGPHEWNMIEFEGESYYVDITWDDSDRKNDSGVFIYTNDSEYEYMNITTEELKKTHAPDTVKFSPPNCLSTKYNYFVYKGYQPAVYDFNEVNRIVTEQSKDKKIISIRFSNIAEYNKAIDDLITNSKAFEIPALSKGYKYLTDNLHFTIKFFLE